MTEYPSDFVRESRERITELNNALLTLERAPDDETVEEIFRIAHTLKGNCGAAGLEAASDLAHAIEDVLEGVRSNRIDVTAELMDDVFDAVDELETIVDELEADDAVETDPSPTISALRTYLEAESITSVEKPSDDEIESILSRFDPPADDSHDAYLARIAVTELNDDGDCSSGGLVVDALTDAFDLIGTVPSRERIDDGPANRTFDAVFGCAVDETAIVSGLEPIERVSDVEIVEVTGRFDSDVDTDVSGSPIEAGTLAEDVDAASISADEARALEIDDLLEEFDEFDDLDEKVTEVEADDDLDVFDEMGDAGSFDDLFEATVADEPSEQVPVESPEPGTESDVASAGGSETNAAGTATDATDDGVSTDDDVEDAGSVFEELKDEVETVGFDELQAELDELEFDEFDDEEEVSMDELLGDEFGEDDAADEADGGLEAVGEDVQDGTDGAVVDDGDDDKPVVDDAGADDRVTADDGTTDDGFGSVDIDEDNSFFDDEATDAGSDDDPLADSADDRLEEGHDESDEPTASAASEPDPATEISFDEFERDSETTVSPVDDPQESGFDDETADWTQSEDAEFGESVSDDGFSAPSNDELESTSTVGTDEESDSSEPDEFVSDVDDGTESVDPSDLVDDESDSFEEAFGDDAFDDSDFGVGIDEAFRTAGNQGSTAETDDSESADVDDEHVERVYNEPDLEIPDITVPERSGRPETDDDEEIQSVRVDTDRVEQLSTLVEGLVTSRVRLRHEVESDRGFQAIEDELDDLEALTTELQETVMDVRLVPLETVVNRLPRVVRDIARDQGKEVDFETNGTDVELDRSVLGRIRDPLIHLVRNAVDHGIEAPSEREAIEKQADGSVEVSATRSRNQVKIEVSDDGSGLDLDRLRSEAIDASVLTEDEATALDDDEVAQLIFEPGFSTATEVTDVSGRGVGMDVVKRTIEEMDGTVSIASSPDEGTTVTMTLPVSIAIDDVLFIQCGDEEFGIPTDAVHAVESARPIETGADGSILPVDDQTYPVVDLVDALGVSERGSGGESGRSGDAEDGRIETVAKDGVAVRIRDSVRPIAVRCDRVHGQQEVVVKPFDGFMSDIPGLSGATVRGRGKVVNIIDVTTL
ncbi:chemotaxis protein CheA [Natrarchaeobius halalkaliphilus]|uniref:Chemotaxis protein CheA n=1 Tax=Natrarchaeobius halalkaliphilus TaxID=1679091 RepID=A0A3N6LMQ1_9EURY|nr:chemotaxis protein CheA [Natrarchaeobius halalkaliphilus]RQG90388.1 chemotaxis protein CheA [Natrarchaeobius halalkaliphilus]